MTPQPELYWRPIETAPKTFDCILLYADGVVRLGYRGETSKYPHSIDLDASVPATHWMPLPTPPES